jgi:hypothetical protein
MATFEEGKQAAASKKIVFADGTFLKHFFGWESDSSVWSQASEQQVTALTENDVTASQQISLAVLQSADTSTVGAWFYDSGEAKLYVKPKSGSTVYENFYVGTLNIVISNMGDTYNSVKREAAITGTPGQNIKTSNVFDGKLARISTGSIKRENTSNFATTPDYEPDGKIALIASFEVY